MSTRYLIAALLMTSSCVAFAQTARTAHQITAVRPTALASDIAVTPPVAGAVASDPIASLPPAQSTPMADPVVVAQPTPVQAAADGTDLPEPSSIALMAAGLFGAVGLRRRRAK
jgi:hypothetical protein